jgi:enoyl-CoA hydratase
MTRVVKMNRDGAVATVTIDRAAEGNLLSIDDVRALAATVRAAAATDAKVIVLRAAGADFCRGRAAAAGGASPSAMQMRANVCEPILDAYAAIEGARQPVVALVQGAAYGFGAAVAAACDITIAADNARFRLPEMEGNLPPTLAMSALLPRMPRKAIAWMVYSMEEIDAARALAFGLVSAVAPLAGLDHALAKLVATMTARSPEALVAVKDFLRDAPLMEPRGMAGYGANLLASVLSSAGR